MTAYPLNGTLPQTVRHALWQATLMMGLATATQAATTYTVTDLPATSFRANALSNTGQAVGTVLTGPNAIYDPVSGTLTNLGYPITGALNFIFPHRINDNGLVLGASQIIVSPRVIHTFAALHEPSGLVTLARVLPSDTYTDGVDINNSGQMLMSNNLPVCNAGVTCNFTDQSLYYYPVYLWTAAGGAKALPKIGYHGQVTSINNLGQISGYTSGLPVDPQHAVVMTATTVKDLHTSAMGLRSMAYKINDNGYLVGSAIFGASGLDQAVSWNSLNGVATNHGNPNSLSQLLDVNNKGQFVGWEDTTLTSPSLGASHTSHAVVGNVFNSGLTDLNTVVTGLPANIKLYSAIDINEAGQILASAFDVSTGGEYGAVLLTPNASPLPACSGRGTLANYPVSKVYLQLSDGTKVGFPPTAAGTTFTGGATAFANGQTINYVGNYDTASAICYATSMTVAPAVITPKPPAAPSGLGSRAVSRSQIALTWTDNASDELGFLIERCNGAGCTNFRQVATVNANVSSYANTGLTRWTSYSYRVRAINNVGPSAYSNTASVRTPF